MTLILLLSLVISFAVLAPHVRHSHGSGALWLLAGAAALLASLAFAFLDEPARSPSGSLWAIFFWPALIAAGTGFGLQALRISRRDEPPGRTSWVEVLLGVLIWLLGAAAGGAVAVGTGLLLLSGMAP